MTDPQPTLLLTRPEPQSRAFLAECEALAGRPLSAVISPILRIVPTGTLPALDRFATIILTSGNGVRRLADRADLRGRKVKTVGAGTATLARAFGADAEALGDDAKAFAEAAASVEGPALLCRGRHTRGDLARQLRDRGILVDEAVIYDQVEQPLSPLAHRLLAGDSPLLVPLFSPRSAALLARQGRISAPSTILAMSPAVADAWSGPGRVLVARAPTAESMCALTVGQF